MSSLQLSKLELYVKILETLVENGSLTIPEIGVKTGFEVSSLVSATEFLEQQRCIDTIKRGRDFLFHSTSKGLSVLKYFGQDGRVMPSKIAIEP